VYPLADARGRLVVAGPGQTEVALVDELEDSVQVPFAFGLQKRTPFPNLGLHSLGTRTAIELKTPSLSSIKPSASRVNSAGHPSLKNRIMKYL